MLVPAALVLALVTPDSAPPKPELEIQASLSGFNLLWPESRCCAFDLHLRPNGALTATITFASGPVTTNSQLF